MIDRIRCIFCNKVGQWIFCKLFLGFFSGLYIGDPVISRVNTELSAIWVTGWRYDFGDKVVFDEKYCELFCICNVLPLMIDRMGHVLCNVQQIGRYSTRYNSFSGVYITEPIHLCRLVRISCLLFSMRYSWEGGIQQFCISGCFLMQ